MKPKMLGDHIYEVAAKAIQSKPDVNRLITAHRLAVVEAYADVIAMEQRGKIGRRVEEINQVIVERFGERTLAGVKKAAWKVFNDRHKDYYA